jgi:hypothetical protein
MGVLYFAVNCVFAIVILFMCAWVSIRALLSKNPDNRYQPMRDDRGSFIKSQTNLGTTELDALGATARGDGTVDTYAMAEHKRMDLEHDNDSSVSTFGQHPINAPGQAYSRSASPLPHANGANSGYSTPYSARNAQQFRDKNNASPANNPWQRGIGY